MGHPKYEYPISAKSMLIKQFTDPDQGGTVSFCQSRTRTKWSVTDLHIAAEIKLSQDTSLNHCRTCRQIIPGHVAELSQDMFLIIPGNYAEYPKTCC